MDGFCGIDVACAKRKRLPVAVVVRDGAMLRSLPLRTKGPTPPRGMGNRRALDSATCTEFAEQTAIYLASVERAFDVTIRVVAIDAPRQPSQSARRVAELAMDQIGVSCIPTPTGRTFTDIRSKIAQHLASGGLESHLPHANQLFRRLGRVYECIEVFPNAIVHAIAPGCPHKSKPEGFQRQLDAFATAARWNPQFLADAAHGSRHDRLDAIMSAWVASLPLPDRVAHGDGHLDTIWNVQPSYRHVV